MEQRGTKEAAESVLRELPSVVGAFVREDVHGYPREVHLLIAPGPKPRHFALDVKAMLEERLGIPIDQRIISIAQLAAPPDVAPAPPAAPAPAPTMERTPPARTTAGRTRVRARFVSAVSEVALGRVTVRATLEWAGTEYEGTAVELEAGAGRVRAAALAVLRAANEICGEHGRFELEGVSVLRMLDREYALAATVASSAFLGRRPLALAGAHPVDDDPEAAGALAALKSVNRLLGWIARLGTAGAAVPVRARRT